MSQLIASIAASDEWQVFLDNLPNLPFATWESFYATALTTFLGLALGLPLGVLLVVGEAGGILPAASLGYGAPERRHQPASQRSVFDFDDFRVAAGQVAAGNLDRYHGFGGAAVLSPPSRLFHAWWKPVCGKLTPAWWKLPKAWAPRRCDYHQSHDSGKYAKPDLEHHHRADYYFRLFGHGRYHWRRGPWADRDQLRLLSLQVSDYGSSNCTACADGAGVPVFGNPACHPL